MSFHGCGYFTLYCFHYIYLLRYPSMEVLFHLIFELVKISILGGVYATLILIASYFWPRRYSQARVWWVSGFAVSLALFLFMFSYWGDHGLGDYERLPIGHGKDVQQIDGSFTYLERGHEQLQISTFVFDRDHLYAKAEDEKGGIVVWVLKSENWSRYTDIEYLRLIKEKDYPNLDKFSDFNTLYDRYWNGWRFFLLP